MMSIADELKLIARGEILSDEWNREVYSVDASHYSIKPSVILFPLDEDDLAEICRYGYSKNVSITARGAGTGLRRRPAGSTGSGRRRAQGRSPPAGARPAPTGSS